MVACDGAGVAFVSTLILDLHPLQLERCVSFGDLVLKHRGPTLETPVLGRELVLVAVVGMDADLVSCGPVDEGVITARESAW